MLETSGAQQENTNYAPLVGNFRGLTEKNMDYAPLVGNFRGSTEKKTDFAPLVRKLPGLSREKNELRPACRFSLPGYHLFASFFFFFRFMQANAGKARLSFPSGLFPIICV